MFSEQGEKELPFIADGYIEKNIRQRLFRVVQHFSMLPYVNLNTSVTSNKRCYLQSSHRKITLLRHVYYQPTVHVDSSQTPLF